MIVRRFIAAGLATVLVLGATSCAGEDSATKAANARVIVPLEASPVPPSLSGLRVEEEDIGEALEGAKRPYLEAATLYSLRDGDALQATLQVGRFAPGERYETLEFRQTLASRIADGAATDVRMGDHTIWLTSGDRQSIAVWFNGGYVFILSAREEYTGSRALLREALGIQP